MDYSQHAAYFAGAPPQSTPFHQFPLGITPLTPSHSNSAASEDFNNTSPPDAFDHYQAEQFQSFDQYATAHFNAHQPAPFRPPTPPSHHPAVHNEGQSHPSHSAIDGVAAPVVKASLPLGLAATKTEPIGDGDRQGSNSADDEELTPAQSRRKAQNRAAQRAFRERKERHVKDLEAKLASLEAAQQETFSENEKLKRDLQKVSTENEILRATSSVRGDGGGGSPSHQAVMTTGPMEYNPTDFYSNVLALHPNKHPSHRIVSSDSGERLYAAGATWDLIINHDLYKKGLVDIADISNRLKHKAKCDGQGPVFEEQAILDAIEQSVASGSDELL
ncbi:unnamed protein product [Discula destructiva]